MTRSLLIVAFLLAAPVGSRARQLSPDLEAEVRKIDARVDHPDGKIIVASAMAERLNIHRNRLVLLRKQTGLSYGRIFVAELGKRGVQPAEIVRQARELNAEIDRRWRDYQASAREEQPGASLRPIAHLRTAADHNSVGTFYSLAPQLGLGTSRAALWISIPYYRSSGADFSTSGLGDVSASAYVSGLVQRVEIGGLLAVGFPTGDESVGLGAGKVTVDGSAILAGRFEKARPFVAAGITNSIFSNVGYQRPFITDGNAAHFSGGLEVAPVWRVLFGGGAFAVRPFGEQTVLSRVVSREPAAMPEDPEPEPGPPPITPGRPPELPPPAGRRRRPPIETDPLIETSAAELRDHGVNAWLSIYLHRAVSLNFSVARSLPFELTTVRVGLGFDVARILSPKRF